MQNKKRLFKAAIYAIYIVLFAKRFLSVLMYFKRVCFKLAGKQTRFIRAFWEETITFIRKLFDLNTATAGPSNKSAFRILLTHLYKIMALAIGLTNLQPTATKKQSGRMLYRSLGRMFSYAISLLAFAYNSFILVQLSCIGIAESQRIRRFMQNAVS